MRSQIVIVLACLLVACNQVDQRRTVVAPIDSVKEISRPNILWLVAEDLSPFLAAYGDSTAYTPNINRLAKEGVVYTNFFSPSGVCAPSRAAIALGMYPTSIGAGHMRTWSHTEVTGLPPYEAVPPTEAKMMSEILRRHGYYCTNNAKQDYQFKAPVTAWDESGMYAHWRNRVDDQPFFAVFNFEETHESGLFEPYGFRKSSKRHFRAGDRTFTIEHGRFPESETTVHVDKDHDFIVPPYLPDNEIVRRDLWKMYNNIAEMDRQVGAILDQLEEDGLLESTVIFFYGDHGGPLPRHKRLLYDTGLKTPLIIRFPDQLSKGMKNEELASFVDLAPTVFSLAGIEPPGYLQGFPIAGSYKQEVARKYIYGAADRFDESTDTRRAVRDRRFKYIRNYRPDKSNYLALSYRERIPTMQELLRLNSLNKLDSIQSIWFQESKPTEELYDCHADPYELVNLAADPKYQEKLSELRIELDRWLNQIGDQPKLPEKDLVSFLWNGSTDQPKTEKPSININDEWAELSCNTEGASIGYRWIEKGQDTTDVWQVYTKKIKFPENVDLQVKGHRIGYQPSDIITISPDSPVR